MSITIQKLEKQLETTTTRIDKVDLLNELVRLLVDVDLERSLALAKESKQLAEGLPVYSQGIYGSVINLSICHMRLGNYDESMKLIMQAHALVTSSDDVQATPVLFSMLGSLYIELGEYSESLDFFIQSFDLAKQQGNLEGEINALNNMGIIYYHLNDFRQGLDCYERALVLYERLDDFHMRAILLNNIAMAYQGMNELETAVSKAKQCLALTRQHNLSMVEGTVLCTIGSIYLKENKIDLAIDTLKQSTQLAQTLGFRSLEIYSLRQIGEGLQKANAWQESLNFLHQSLQIASQIQNHPEIVNCHKALAESYKQQGDYVSALAHFEKFHQLDKEIYNDKADRNSRQLQILHQTKAVQQEAEFYKQKTEDLDAYARSVAHDLKQPISVIKTYSDILPYYLPDLDDDSKVVRAMTKIKSASDRLESIVDALLLLATVNKAEVILKPVDMEDVIDNVLDRLQESINNYRGRVILPEKWEIVSGYQPWIEEIWVNYLSNGLKYGGKVPVLTLGSERESDNMIRFWVNDNGPGIPDDFSHEVFNEFSRIEQRDEKGHGLGLAIVRRIVERLGGYVGFENQPDEGCQFFFTLPIVDASFEGDKLSEAL